MTATLFYILLIPTLIFQLYLVVYLRRVERNDRVLFGFTRMKYKLIDFIASEGKNLNSEDLTATFGLLEHSMVLINKFNGAEHKFNVRRLMLNLREVDKTVVSHFRTFDLVENEQLKHLYMNMMSSIIQAFITYTPLLRYHLVIQISVVTARLFDKIARTKWMLRIQEIRERWAHLQSVAGTTNRSDMYCPTA